MKDTPKETYDFYYNYYKNLFLKYRKELYFDKLNEVCNITIPDIDLGVKYAILIRHSFSGIVNEKCGYSYSSTSFIDGKKCPEPKSQILIRKLDDIKLIDKLKKINTFECLDFEQHINKYDSINTLFYVDPPYKGTENKYYRGINHFGDVWTSKII